MVHFTLLPKFYVYLILKGFGWILASLLGLALLLVLLPTFLVIFILAISSSLVVSVLIKIKYGNKITRAYGPDAMFGKQMTTSLPYINTVCRVQGQPDIEEIRRTFNIDIIEARDSRDELIYKKFTQLFEKRFGYYIWKECMKFDIKDHIRLIAMQDIIDEIKVSSSKVVNPTENSPTTEKKRLISSNKDEVDYVVFKNGVKLRWEEVVHYFMARHGTALMKEHIPQWEILIAVEDENHFLVLFRVHHSISDGINLSRFVLEAMFKTNIQVPIQTQKRSKLQSALAMVASLTFLPYEIATLVLTKLSKNPLHGPQLTGQKIYLVSRMYSLQFLKNLKKNSGATINNILLSCVSHAMSSHFERKSTVVDHIVVMTPYAMQDMSKPLKLRNQFNLIRMRLPTSLDHESLCCFRTPKNKSYLQTPHLKRLQLVKETLDRAKANIGHLSINWIGKKLGYLLPACISEALFNSEGITLVLSNVPGPQVELSYWDGVQKELFFWIPDRDPMGIGISIMSYNGRLRITLIVDKALMSGKEEAQLFMDDFEKALSHLEEDSWQLVNSFDDVV